MARPQKITQEMIEKARVMRAQEGKSIQSIAQELKIGFGSAQAILRDIKPTPTKVPDTSTPAPSTKTTPAAAKIDEEITEKTVKDPGSDRYEIRSKFTAKGALRKRALNGKP